jgi:hypothetical protein
MLKERLNSLMILTADREIAINLNTIQIIDDFKNSTEHRIMLRPIIIIYQIDFVFHTTTFLFIYTI